MKYLADIGADFFGSGNASKLAEVKGVGSLVSIFVKSVFAISGLVILYFFILAGFGMIQGAGNNDPKKMEQSKATMTSALIGFTVVFVSYWIVKLIEQLTGVLILQ